MKALDAAEQGSSTSSRSLCEATNIKRIGKSYLLATIKGRQIIVGPHWPGVVFTFAIIVGGTSVNFKMVEQANQTSALKSCLNILICCFCFLTVVTLALTATRSVSMLLTAFMS